MKYVSLWAALLDSERVKDSSVVERSALYPTGRQFEPGLLPITYNFELSRKLSNEVEADASAFFLRKNGTVNSVNINPAAEADLPALMTAPQR